MAKNNWIEKALSKHKKGTLHKALDIPMGEKIPAAKLAEGAKMKGVTGQRARLAQTLNGFKKPEPIKSISEMKSKIKSKGII
jgi:hypothetical protein